MSDLSELIKTTKNIEKQNAEIIRLLKKIAGEEEPVGFADGGEVGLYFEDTDTFKMAIKSNADIFNDLANSENEEKEIEVIDDEIDENSLFYGIEPEVGEVCFVDGVDVFKLTIKNNEMSLDNLTGSTETTNYSLQEIIANESIKNNQSLDKYTVILGEENVTNLPEILRICYEHGAKKIYIPWFSMTQLVGAPDTLMRIMKLDFYKSEEELIEKLFG